MIHVISNSIEINKYNVESLTIRFYGKPTVKQAISVGKALAMCGSIKPDFNSPIFEVHMSQDDDLTKVQFYPSYNNRITKRVN